MVGGLFQGLGCGKGSRNFSPADRKISNNNKGMKGKRPSEQTSHPYFLRTKGNLLERGSPSVRQVPKKIGSGRDFQTN